MLCANHRISVLEASDASVWAVYFAMFVGVLGPQRVPSAGSSDHSMVLGQVGGRTRGAPVSEWSQDKTGGDAEQKRPQ